MAENNNSIPSSTPAPESTSTDTSTQELATDAVESEVLEQVEDALDTDNIHEELVKDASGKTAKKTADKTKEAVKAEKEVRKRIKSLKLKVDGKEFDEQLPFEIDDDPKVMDYLKRELQLSKMAQKRGQETSHLQKEITSFFEQLRKDPFAVLADPNIGIDVKEEIAKFIEGEIENSKKSPEQVAKEKLETELNALKKERETEKAEMQKKEIERLQQSAYDEYDRQITQALEQSTLPKNPYTIKKIAEYMLLGLQEGIDVNAADVIPLVQEEMKKELKDMFGVMPEDVIEEFIGKDTLSKLRKKNVAKVKAAPSNKTLDVGKKTEPATGKAASKISYKDFFKS